MDRTIPKTGSEEIELYMRTYYSLLRSTHPVQIMTLMESHMGMGSSLHVDARELEVDIAALIYAVLRLPPCIYRVNLVLLGQSSEVFANAGYTDVDDWERAVTPARRRRSHFNGQDVLAVYIASRSDIDDFLPTLVAYQIEWNKIHRLFHHSILKLFMAQNADRLDNLTAEDLGILAEGLDLPVEDLERLRTAWGEYFGDILRAMAEAPKHMSIQLLAGSLAHYRKATSRWWTYLAGRALEQGIDLAERPVYFVSSNTHSLINLVTGYALRHADRLLDYIYDTKQSELIQKYEELQQSAQFDRNWNNFLYYLLGKYAGVAVEEIREALGIAEANAGVMRIPSRYGFDVEAQLISLRDLHRDWLDPRIGDIDGLSLLDQSDAVILNIDYPLGMAAYELLNEVAYQVGRLLGVYVMGKAASLNGRIGDVMIPNVVHDEHSQNTYLFDNCFQAADVAPYMSYGSALDNQKAISVRGTFLQNTTYMEVFYREGYTDIEMEAGPYLSAVYEAFRPKRHPYNEIVNLYGVGFDIGVLHYASDTPMTKGRNLGAVRLGFDGVDPTYAATIAILRRLFGKEVSRLQKAQSQRAALAAVLAD